VRKILLSAAFISLFVLAAPARAQDSASAQDADGCKESPLISRFSGSHISSCENLADQKVDVQVGSEKDGSVSTKTIEGEYHSWVIATRDGVSEAELFEDFEAALQSDGLQIDYENKPAALTAHSGNIWVVFKFGNGSYDQTIVISNETQQAVQANAAFFSEALAQAAHIALYGVLFETNKATFQPDSDFALHRMLKFLQDLPDQTLHVVGYTDNTGDYDDNLKLAQARAEAIVAWLVDRGIDKTRLIAKGFGDADSAVGSSAASGIAPSHAAELAEP
jgi:outer membrane protein OmpA-like peptidoglycan-associated protein